MENKFLVMEVLGAMCVMLSQKHDVAEVPKHTLFNQFSTMADIRYYMKYYCVCDFIFGKFVKLGFTEKKNSLRGI